MSQQMTEGTTAVAGWELHFQAGSSDKFYRILSLPTGEGRWTTLAQWGRRDARGQMQAWHSESQNAAHNKAVEKTEEKEQKHYLPSRDFTNFEVPSEWVDELIGSHGGVNPSAALRIFEAFIRAADQAGNTHQGASR